MCHYFSLSLKNGTCYDASSLSSYAEEVPLAQSLSQRNDAIDNYADVAMSIPRI